MDDKQFRGFNDLDKKLRALGAGVGGKVLQQSLSVAATPAVKAIRQNAPVGKKPHRTYKGRLVLPGFLSRSIKKRSRLSKSRQRATVEIGASAEAFYGPQFIQRGTKHIQKTEWMTTPFEQSQSAVIGKFKRELSKRIERIARK